MIENQNLLMNRVDNLSLDSFPRTLLLLGDQGCGRHTLAKYIGEKFQLPVTNITDNLTDEMICFINEQISPKIYIIDGENLSIKDQNTILKFLEEPLKNAYIILICENTLGLLDTIPNRCTIWSFEKYQPIFLKKFLKNPEDDFLISVLTTPGQILMYQDFPIKDMSTLADKILDKIEIANIANVLTLSNKLAFKGEKDKFDVHLFFKILLLRSVNKYTTSDIENQDTAYAAYKLTNRLLKSSKILNADLKYLFENYLLQLRTVMRRGSI